MRPVPRGDLATAPDVPRRRDTGRICAVHIPAKVDYGIRALLTLAAAGTPQTAEYLAGEQGLPPRFLGAILADLRRAGVVASQRGAEGGYRLAREPDAITIADVIRALDGPLAEVRGFRPEATSYDGAAENLQQVWVAVRASLRIGAREGHPDRRDHGQAAPARAEDGHRPRCLDRPLTPRSPARSPSRRRTSCGSSTSPSPPWPASSRSSATTWPTGGRPFAAAIPPT